MTDRLAVLLEHFSINAQTFQSGRLCGTSEISGDEPSGQLHLVKEGHVEVWHGNKVAFKITEPSLLFYPRPMPRRFVMHHETGAELICAHVAFEGGAANPIINALPSCVCFPLTSLPHSLSVLTLLFAEADAQYCGRQAILNRFFEVVIVQLLRTLMEENQMSIGLLSGLSHPQLRLAIVAMHESPDKNWSVQDLASISGMSRSVFSNQFRQSVGETPAHYLQHWRIVLVQKWLKQGCSLKLIVEEAGYSSESALSRAFKSQTGLSPRDWLKSII